MIKFAWGITGAGDKLEETIQVMNKIKEFESVNIEVFLSKEGEKVVKYYKVKEDLEDSFDKVWVEVDANTPFLAARLQMKEFKFLIIAPATSNTVAKITYGISDTLLTNAALQGVKGFVPVYILAVDFKEGLTSTILPNGKKLKLRVRKEDAENVKKLSEMDGFTVFEKPEKIFEIYQEELGCPRANS
jgi:archaeoflavoprotein AfpA